MRSLSGFEHCDINNQEDILRIVYVDDQVEVLFRPADSSLLMVTFNHATYLRTGQSFWGAKLVEQMRCGALGIVTKSVNWFPADSMRAAVAAAESCVAGFSEILTLGFSMGAYGALKYGRLFGAHLSVAFSPQSPNVRAAMPNSLEARTPEAYRGLDVGPADVCPRPYVFYDPLVVADRSSMQLMTDAGTRLILGRTYGTGHANVELLKKDYRALIDACRADDRAQISSLWSKARRINPRRAENLARATLRRRPALAAEIYARHAAGFSSVDAADLLIELAHCFVRARNYEAAQAAIQTATPLAAPDQLPRLQGARDALARRLRRMA